MDHKISKLLGKPTLEGQVGESHVWDGPLDTTGFPMGKGCLLYTSPSPRDRQKSRMPSSA